MPQPDSRDPWIKRLIFRIGGSRPGAWLILTFGTRIDRLLIRLTGGRLSMVGTMPVLILTTIGAKTGQPRTTPLLFINDGPRLVLIASNGGNPKHPGWYYNLRANPEATVFLQGRTARYIAHEATGTERETLWQRAVALYSGYTIYQGRASRQIPIMVLTPPAQ